MLRLTTETARDLVLAAMASAAVLVLHPQGASAQGVKLAPVDEAARDPSLIAYRKTLLQAVRARNSDAVAELASPDVMLSFGGDAGRESLRRNLEGFENWQGEAYWSELQRVLELGGVFLDDGAFCTPYLACLDVPGCPECDPYETVFVTGENVAARAEPDLESRIVAQLSYDVLPLDVEAYSGEDWYPVRLATRRRAFVSEADARMAIDYRARFEKIGGRWHMTVFIAGD
ncbi:MAG: SH3 domain-containing protein [Rhodospirillales bacterium]|nr:MAG: SH3 domain-containing protein [Rhodospirillales bacterium]